MNSDVIKRGMGSVDRNFRLPSNLLLGVVFSLGYQMNAAAAVSQAWRPQTVTSFNVRVADTGETFSLPLPDGCDAVSSTQAVLDRRRNVVVVFEAAAAHGEQANRGGIFALIGRNAGTRFSKPYGISRNGTNFTVDQPRLLIDTYSTRYPNRVYVIWRASLLRNGTTLTQQLFFSWAADGGGPYSQPLPLDGPAVKDIDADIAITGDATSGELIVSWTESVNGVRHRRRRVSNNGGISFLAD